MTSSQVIQRSPGLTQGIDILAVIFANRTVRRWLIALCELMPTCSTNIVLHLRSLYPELYALVTRISHGLHGLASIPAWSRRKMNSQSPRSIAGYLPISRPKNVPREIGVSGLCFPLNRSTPTCPGIDLTQRAVLCYPLLGFPYLIRTRSNAASDPSTRAFERGHPLGR